MNINNSCVILVIVYIQYMYIRTYSILYYYSTLHVIYSKRLTISKETNSVCEEAEEEQAVASIIMANARSLDNKMDHIRLLRSANRTVSDCCVLVFTETWLNDNIPDSAVHLEQLA